MVLFSRELFAVGSDLLVNSGDEDQPYVRYFSPLLMSQAACQRACSNQFLPRKEGS